MRETTTASPDHRPPLLSSQDAGWNAIFLEHHRQPAQEISETNLTCYLINIYLGEPIEVEHWMNGRLFKDCRVKGDILIAPPGLCPKIRRQQEGEFLLLRLEPRLVAHAVQELVEPEQLKIIRHFRIRDPLIHQIGLNLKTELETNAVSSYLYAESAAHLLSIHLVRRYSEFSLTPRNYADGLSPCKLRRVIEFIQDNLAGNLSLANIACEVGMSQYYFSRLFKQSIGVSVYQYVMQCRMERAMQLLQHNELMIADIARLVGFADQSHFTRQFKRLVGTTPLKFRNQ
ncbi:helix-turn-helix transcriptional regulator [Scytonema sp. PRP1]|uniref:helix-turn-helix transcriptional regulator n=1 Tax=Scytonema sp. PRP1 TaxID=3120513 RepID=UPI002FD32FAA